MRPSEHARTHLEMVTDGIGYGQEKQESQCGVRDPEGTDYGNAGILAWRTIRRLT